MAMILYPEFDDIRPMHGGDRFFACLVSRGVPAVGDIVTVNGKDWKVIWFERFTKGEGIPGENFAIEVIVAPEERDVK